MKAPFRTVYTPDQPCASFYHDTRLYREYSPSPSLAEYVFCYWTSPPDGIDPALLPGPSQETIVPDSCIDIVFNITSDGISSSIAGPYDIPFTIPVDLACAKDFGVRFLLPDFFMFTGVSPLDLINGSYNARDVFGEGWSTIEARIFNAAGDEDRVRILNDSLPLFSKPSDKYETIMTRMFASVFNAGGYIAATDIANAADVSLRHLNRICKEQTGLNVKTVARIIRFQSFIRRYRSSSDMSFSEAAYEAGFSDQAHMIREFRLFSGKTPSSVL